MSGDFQPQQNAALSRKQENDSVHTIHTRDERLVSGSTAWWLDHAPNAYRYYCIHDTLLTESCDKCKGGVMKFVRKYEKKKRGPS